MPDDRGKGMNDVDIEFAFIARYAQCVDFHYLGPSLGFRRIVGSRRVSIQPNRPHAAAVSSRSTNCSAAMGGSSCRNA
jgi:hypothetical protein